MKPLTIIALGVMLYSSAGSAAELRELSMKPFSRIWSELSEDRKTVKIMAESAYMNNCFMDKNIYKSKKVANSQREYRVYRSIEEDKNCIKVYLPIDRIYTVDEIPVEDFSSIRSISVNDIAL